MISRRSKYAVPNAETRHGSIGGNCQALPEECSEAENRKLLAQTIEEYEHNVSSEKKCASSNWKSDGEGNATMDNCGIDSWPSRCVQQRSTLHDVTVKARETPKGTGNLHEQEAAASSPCRVVGSGPASSAGEWDRHGGGSRPGSARQPVWCTARAGSGPSAGPGTVEARWGSRLGRVRPGRGPGHSGSEKRQPAGQVRPGRGPGHSRGEEKQPTGQVRPGRGPGHNRGEEKQPTGQRAAVTSTDR